MTGHAASTRMPCFGVEFNRGANIMPPLVEVLLGIVEVTRGRETVRSWKRCSGGRRGLAGHIDGPQADAFLHHGIITGAVPGKP